MKTTPFTQLCKRLFGRLFISVDTEEEKEKNLRLERANILMPHVEYASWATMTTLISGIICLFISLILFFFSPLPLLQLLFFSPLFVPLIIGVVFLILPDVLTSQRAQEIDRFLPYSINFLNTMSETGLSPAEIFRTLSTIDMFGELKTEAATISKEINIMGVDNITALNHAIERTPSKRFKSFLQGLIGTLQSGSNLSDYLGAMVEHYMNEDLIERQKNLEFMGLIAELFIMGVIAFPLFLVIILSVMGFVGNSSVSVIDVLFLLSFLALPLIYILFYVMIKTSTLEEIGKAKTDVQKSFTQLFRENRGRYIVISSSIGLVLALQIVLILLQYFGILTLSLFQYIDVAFLSILILIGPYGFFMNMLQKRREEAQMRLPDLFSAIANQLSAGTTIYQAIKTSSRGSYGRLTKEIQKMNSEISWNIPVKEVFDNFDKRMKNPIITRSILTITSALSMGGNTAKIFKAASKELNQINDVHQQRKANMSMYTVVIVMCFFVFLFIMYIIQTTLFTHFLALTAGGTSEYQGLLTSIDSTGLLYGIYSFIFIQGIGSGILSGYLMDGNLSSGSRLAFILGVVSILAFKLLFI